MRNSLHFPFSFEQYLNVARPSNEVLVGNQPNRISSLPNLASNPPQFLMMEHANVPYSRRTRFSKDKAFVCSYPNCGASFYHRTNVRRHECYKHGRSRKTVASSLRHSGSDMGWLADMPVRDPEGRPSLTAATVADDDPGADDSVVADDQDAQSG